MVVVLTSGRMSSSVRGIAEELGLEDYIISGNGALIYDIKNNKVMYDNCLPLEKALQVVNICEENSIYYTINTEKYIISNSLKYNLRYYNYENQRKEENKRTSIQIVQNVQEFISQNDVGKITKMTISDETKTIFDRITKKLKEVEGINILEVSNMSRKAIEKENKTIELNYYYTEITNENVNKWNALKYLAKEIDVKPEEIIAIGDNMNDYDMITNAGLRNCYER